MDPRLERAIELGFRNIRSGSTSIGPEAIALAIAFNNGAAWVPGCCMGKNTCYAMERDHRNRFVLKDGFETVDEARAKMQPWDVLILPNDQIRHADPRP